MANGEKTSWAEVVRKPILKVDTYMGKDFEAAVNCNRELYTGFDNIEEMRKRAQAAFSKGQQS